MKLLLTSGGIHNSFRNDFLSLLPEKPIDKISVSYITTAAFGEGKYELWKDNAKKDLQKLGILDIADLDIRNKTEKQLYLFLFRLTSVSLTPGR